MSAHPYQPPTNKLFDSIARKIARAEVEAVLRKARTPLWRRMLKATFMLRLVTAVLTFTLTVVLFTTAVRPVRAQNTAVMETKIEDMDSRIKDGNHRIEKLIDDVQNLKQDEALMRGMVIGFGGLVTLLEIIKAFMGLRERKPQWERFYPVARDRERETSLRQ